MAVELFTHSLFSDANLTHYYRLEANSNDSKGTLHGTDSNVSYAACKFNNGAVYNGTNAKASTSGLAISGTNNFTLWAWLKAGAQVATYNIPIWNGIDDPNPYKGFGFLRKPNSMVIYAGWGSSAGEITGPTLTQGTIYFLVSTWNGTTHTFYVNGESVGTPATYALSNFLSGNFELGSLAGAYWANDTLDDIATFSRALSGAEILAYYNYVVASGGSPSFITNFV